MDEDEPGEEGMSEVEAHGPSPGGSASEWIDSDEEQREEGTADVEARTGTCCFLFCMEYRISLGIFDL